MLFLLLARQSSCVGSLELLFQCMAVAKTLDKPALTFPPRDDAHVFARSVNLGDSWAEPLPLPLPFRLVFFPLPLPLDLLPPPAPPPQALGPKQSWATFV